MRKVIRVKLVEKCWRQPQTKAFSLALAKEHGLMLDTCTLYHSVLLHTSRMMESETSTVGTGRLSRWVSLMALCLHLSVELKACTFIKTNPPCMIHWCYRVRPYLLINDYGHFDVCSKVVTYDAPWKEQSRPFRVWPQQPEHRGEHEEREQVSPAPISQVSHRGRPHCWQTVGVRRLRRRSDVLGNLFVYDDAAFLLTDFSFSFNSFVPFQWWSGAAGCTEHEQL